MLAAWMQTTTRVSVSDDLQHVTGLPGIVFDGLRRTLNSMVNTKTTIIVVQAARIA